MGKCPMQLGIKKKQVSREDKSLAGNLLLEIEGKIYPCPITSDTLGSLVKLQTQILGSAWT